MLLAVGLLVATWLVDTGLDLSNAAYPAPSVAALLTVWVVTVLPGVVLLGGASFALGTLWPRRATMLKLAVLIIWVALFAVDTTHFPTWFAYWNPTSTSLAAASEQQMVQTFQLHGQTLAAAQEGQTHLPDLQPWLLPHVGLVGPNGAGKTTLMRILATLVPPSSGKAHWNGKDMRTEGQAVRRVLGYLPQEFGVYPEFSGRQFLRYLAGMKGLPADLARRRTDEVLELVNLEDAANRKLGSYSGGMKQGVGIAQALLNDPELLIVDEPTVGLDPAERMRFRTLLGSLTASRLVILSTPIIGDVEAVANRLVVLNAGKWSPIRRSRRYWRRRWGRSGR